MVKKELITGIAVGIVVGLVIGYGVMSLQVNGLQDKINSLQQQNAANNALIESLNQNIKTQEAEIQKYKEIILNLEQLNSTQRLQLDSFLIAIHSFQYSTESYKYQVAYFEYIYSTLFPGYEPSIDYEAVYGGLSFVEWWELNKASILMKP